MSPQKSPADFIIVLTTCDSDSTAQLIARSLVTERLAACVNVVPGLTSCFRWKGEVCQETESLLIVKSKAALFSRLRQRIAELHTYELPEIIALPLVDGSEEYLHWLEEAVGA